MKQQWLDHCMRLAATPGDFHAGTRKIFRNTSLDFDDIDNDMTEADAGYKKLKMTLLRKLYVHEDSIQSAIDQWDTRSVKAGYGSVGFTCYNHLLKPHSSENRNGRSSQHGPCLQSVILTINKQKQAEVDVLYRTTELYKKFPADLVLIRDDMLSRFNFEKVPFKSMKCHFVNMSINPTYISVIIPLVDDWKPLMKRIKKGDPWFYTQCLKWLTILTQDEFIKFKQVRNTSEALKRSLGEKPTAELRRWVIKERAKL